MPLKPLRWIPDIQDSDLPTYKAIAESVKAAIDSGLLKPGDKLPTHRALADTLNLAIGTITRGYAEAERLKIIEAQVGSGTFVSSPKHKDTEFKINEEKPGIIDLSVSVAIPVHTHYISDSFNQIVSQPKLFEQLSKYHPDTGTQKYLELIVLGYQLLVAKILMPKEYLQRWEGNMGFLWLYLQFVKMEIQ